MIKSGAIIDLVVLLIFGAFVYISYYVSKQGRSWYIRPIEALIIMEEGVGRAAEMGRPVVMTPGMSGLNSPLTLAGLSITGEINQQCASIGVKPINITSDASVSLVLEAMVRNTFLSAGKEDEYAPGQYVHWTGGEQFAYATYLMGTIMSEKPATVIFVGNFLSDIMMNAEIGKRVDALEVGGTLDTTAMATMAMVCDSVLIGEEIYAAAATITKDDVLAGSIAGQDWSFVLMLAILVLGIISCLAGIPLLKDLLMM
jgi:hypothetical protein